ncbi:MAG: reductive dehalogenase, partial [Desulfobacterales bacterium]|nr:reductive dehalogenase [Desulfobacterales bacterium]
MTHLKDKQTGSGKGLNRRDFMKLGGLTAGLSSLGVVGSAATALAGERPDSPITDFAVSHVDTPTYKEAPFQDSEKLKRFDYRKVAFENEALMSSEFNGKYWYEAMADVQVKKANENLSGFTHLDWALDQAAWTTYNSSYYDDAANPANMLSWEPLMGPLHKDLKAWQGSPRDNNHYIKKAAHFFGAGPSGVARVNEKWFYSRSAYPGYPPIIFSDKHDRPLRTNDACYIPKKMNRVIVMTTPTDGMLLKYTPTTTGGLGTSHGYSRMVELAGKMAEFIRMLGYNAIPTADCASNIVPQAIDAGLGELGRNGLLVNPELGQNLRITTVVTDMPLAPDKPIKFGVAEFCKTCKKCATLCPSQSIPTGDDTSYDVACPSNNPGMKKYYVNTWSCLNFWVKSGGGCSNCIAVCPYSKPGTWIHDIVKAVSSKTTLFNRTFVTMDDILGYGSTYEKHTNPMEWWTSKGRPKT